MKKVWAENSLFGRKMEILGNQGETAADCKEVRITLWFFSQTLIR